MKNVFLLTLVIIPLIGCSASVGVPSRTTTTYETPAVSSTTYTTTPVTRSTTVTRTTY